VKANRTARSPKSFDLHGHVESTARLQPYRSHVARLSRNTFGMSRRVRQRINAHPPPLRSNPPSPCHMIVPIRRFICVTSKSHQSTIFATSDIESVERSGERELLAIMGQRIHNHVKGQTPGLPCNSKLTRRCRKASRLNHNRATA
jgi:hypothetical protein